MARIVLGSYMFRYPLGGMLSWVLQYLLGLQALGHDIIFVEKYGYANSCYDPVRGIMSDDCSYGIKEVSALLSRFGLDKKWCFVQRGGYYHGMSKQAIEEVFRTADIFIDMGTHGSWAEEASWGPLQVLIDGEPGYTQILMEKKLAQGIALPEYDRYFTNGINIGCNGNPAPTAGKRWGHVFHPVKTDLFPRVPVSYRAPFTTIMNWRSHDPLEFQGKVYGQKDMEFPKFLNLPSLVEAPMELALSGNNLPVDMLNSYGWEVKSGKEITRTFDSFREYLSASKGEFSVCKNVFVDTNTAWFSDKSAAFLASGRPVILQDTGFSTHLPTGRGLFAVKTVDDAKEAITEIDSRYEEHSKAAREIAAEYFEAKKVMGQLLSEIGI